MKNRTAALERVFAVMPMSALAKALGVTFQAVSNWDQVPHLRVEAVSKITGISPRALRPDLYGPDPAMVRAVRRRAREFGVQLSPKIAQAILVAALDQPMAATRPQGALREARPS